MSFSDCTTLLHNLHFDFFRLKLLILFSGVTQICDDNWDYNDAVVVCRELGFPGAVSALGSDAFGPGSTNQRILLDNVRCVGTETDLLSCPHDPIGVSDCTHVEDASVICNGHCKLSLYFIRNKYSIVILFSGPSCEISWRSRLE